MKNITKEDVINTVRKMQEDQKQVSKYLKGEITKEELYKKGIKLVKPF